MAHAAHRGATACKKVTGPHSKSAKSKPMRLVLVALVSCFTTLGVPQFEQLSGL